MIKKKIAKAQHFIYLRINKGKGLFGVAYNVFMAFLVVIVCITFVISTYPISEEFQYFLIQLDTTITIAFLVDYLLRFYGKKCSIRYLFTPMALIDLIAILPLFMAGHWQFIRILRLFRVLRLIRLFRKGKLFFFRLSEVRFRQARIFFTLFCIIFISSGLIYDVEFQNTPYTFFDALYFTIVTLTTVGYGDIAPISTGGRVITLMMIMSGVVLIPWQLSSLARYVIETRSKVERKCEACGLMDHDRDAKFCKRCGEGF